MIVLGWYRSSVRSRISGASKSGVWSSTFSTTPDDHTPHFDAPEILDRTEDRYHPSTSNSLVLAFLDVHLLDVHLLDVLLLDVHLLDVHLLDVHLLDVHLLEKTTFFGSRSGGGSESGYRRIPRRRPPLLRKLFSCCGAAFFPTCSSHFGQFSFPSFWRSIIRFSAAKTFSAKLRSST